MWSNMETGVYQFSNFELLDRNVVKCFAAIQFELSLECTSQLTVLGFLYAIFLSGVESICIAQLSRKNLVLAKLLTLYCGTHD